MNKFSPKFFLTLTETNSQVLSAVKIQSLTCHMQIKIDSPYTSFIATGNETSLGRIRANNSNNIFYIFDYGVNPRDIKPGQKVPQGQKLRRQLGTILYTNQREGQQVDRHIELFTPEIVDPSEGVKSWFDDDKKKDKISAEYQLYLDNLAQGKVTVNMSSNKVQDDDPEIAKQDTAGITAYETLSDTQSLVGGSIKQKSRKNFSLVNK